MVCGVFPFTVFACLLDVEGALFEAYNHHIHHSDSLDRIRKWVRFALYVLSVIVVLHACVSICLMHASLADSKTGLQAYGRTVYQSLRGKVAEADTVHAHLAALSM